MNAPGNEDPISTDQAEASLPEVLLHAFQQKRVFNARGEKIPLHSNVSLAEAATLFRLIRHLKPRVSAEVGFAQGISTLALLKAQEDNNLGMLHVIDPYQERFEDAGLAMVKRAGLSSHMQFHRAFADEVIPGLPALQFGFIDSSHLFDLTISEFVMMDRKLEVGGMIAFHDTWMPSLQKFLRYVLANRSYELVRTFDAPHATPKPGVKNAVKHLLLRSLRFVPKGSRIFREELLKPWPSFHISNLVALRKTGPDERDWMLHQPF